MKKVEKSFNLKLFFHFKGGTADWQEFRELVRTKPGGGIHQLTVPNLESDTYYFFRIKLVHKSGKRGLPSPEARDRTLCGKPAEAPKNIQIQATYHQISIQWDPIPKESWKCGKIVYTLKYSNGTHDGSLDFEPDETRAVLPTVPGATWRIQMRTQSIDITPTETKRGQASEWSREHVVEVPSFPDDIFVDLQAMGPDKIVVAWELPEKDRDFPYGVDIQYQLKQRGSCPEQDGPPNTEYNVKDKRKILEVFLFFNLQKFEKVQIHFLSLETRTKFFVRNYGQDPNPA